MKRIYTLLHVQDHDLPDVLNTHGKRFNIQQTLFFFVVSFIFVTLFSRSTSFLYVFEGGDPSVFKQMGLSVLKGKIMYVDHFDNKGCLLYFLHALGLWLGGNTMLLLFQAISLTATLILWNKMLALYRTVRQRALCLTVALVMLLAFYCAGDQCQEWCLPFISYPLLLSLRAHRYGLTIQHRQILLIGICFGIITFIQINNASVFLGFVAYLWWRFMVKKEFRKLLQSIGCFLSGWLIIALPCILYFYFRAGWHGVHEMFYASFLSNFEYINGNYHIRRSFLFVYTLFFLSFTTLTVVNSYKEKSLLIPIQLSVVFFLVSSGKLCNMYYLIAFLPLCVLAMAAISFKRKTINYGAGCVMALSLTFYLCTPMLHFVNDLLLQNEKEVAIYDEFRHCISIIPENERDSIYNYNLHYYCTGMMQHEGLIQCNRTLFTSLAFILPTLRKEETSKPFCPPKWFLLSFDGNYEDDDLSYILENYEIAYTFHHDRIYHHKPKIGEEFDIYLFRRIN